MRNYKILLFAAALALASCGKTGFSGQIAVDKESEIVVRALDINAYTVLDTIKTSATGEFSYTLDVAKGQPEFIYLFYGERRIAGMLLERGEKAVVEADTLGNYSVSGSEGSALLAEVDKSYTQFNNDLYAARDNGPQMAQIYLEHYRACIKHLLGNPYSMTNIPVLYQSLGEASSVFSQPSDAIFFQTAADSLKTVYPESRYVKALAKEAERRMKYLQLETTIRNAEQITFPEINLPDIKGEKQKLSSVDAKVILIHFWDVENVEQKMMNLDVLLPIYNQYKAKGLEIYSVCISRSKALWGTVVSTQQLPWINVFDVNASSAPIYNVQALPHSLLIIDGTIQSEVIKGETGLRKVLDKAFRP